MQIHCFKKTLSNIIYLGLVVTIAIFPVAPVSSIAAEVKNNTATVVLEDQSKTEVLATTAETTVKTPPTETTETSPTLKPEATSKDDDKGMSTGMKYTLGVGGAVVALVGIAALAGGGSSDSPPTPPTNEEISGPWTANANSVDGRTYSGTYTLYSGGSHSYDIYVSDGQHKVGSGAWKLIEYDLELRNYNGSTYRGTFAQGVKNTVTTYTTDGRWKNVLTK